MVVERQPVNDFVHRLLSFSETLAAQPAHLQAAPQALVRRIVPAVSLTAHRAEYAVAGLCVLEQVPAVLGDITDLLN